MHIKLRVKIIAKTNCFARILFLASFLFCLMPYAIGGDKINIQATPEDVQNSEKPGNPPLSFVPEPDWVEKILQESGDRLKKNPPSFPPPTKRQEALMLLDGPLHLEKANQFKSVYEFLCHRMESAVSSIENAEVKKGARVWKLYNHGFVVKTPSVAIGFDIFRGWYSQDQFYGISDELCEKIVSQIDVLFVTHHHGDHFDPVVVNMILSQKKPVVICPDIAPQLPRNPLVHIERKKDIADSNPGNGDDFHAFQTLKLSNGRAVQFIAYPGHQGPDVLNNVYLVRTPENFTFMHTGDQAGHGDWEWLDRLGDFQKVDVLLVNCWTHDMWRMLEGMRPGMVITGHEMEMGHAPDHREAFWRSFQLFRDQTRFPAYIMCWGEHIDFIPEPSP